jgi:acyl-CoA synthetase (AMP-forming)/AMP-acid ligase II
VSAAPVDETLAALLDRQAAERPDHVAVAQVTGDGDVEELTFARLHDEAVALAG